MSLSPERRPPRTEPPCLTNGRFRLRWWRPDDLHAIEDAARDPSIPMTTSVPSVYSTIEAVRWVERQRVQWEARTGYPFAIVDAVSDEALGFVGLWPEGGGGAAVAGYWVCPAARGRGVAAAGLTLLTDWACQDRQIVDVRLFIEPGNRASRQVAERAGFAPEGMMQHAERQGVAGLFLIYSRRWDQGYLGRRDLT